MNRDVDDLTPLDARESLLMEHRPPRKDLSEMSRFNFTGPYQPYRELAGRHDRTTSTDRLVDADHLSSNPHARSLSQESRGTRHSVEEGRQATTPGYGFAY